MATQELELGTLESDDLRKAWKHEAQNFTPWLAENLDRLSAALAGIGRRNCGSRLLIYQMAFKPRFPGVLGSLK